jgi:glycosyltransferase involved in cell wall biosynthesis
MKLININDIQIFILTYNRANYLKDSINSLLNQTIRPNIITILDNNSTDNTEEVVSEFEKYNVKYVKTYGF